MKQQKQFVKSLKETIKGWEKSGKTTGLDKIIDKWVKENFGQIDARSGLRKWQVKCLKKALQWFTGSQTFFINAAPGSGKTIAAIVLAKWLMEHDIIDQVIIIAPRTSILGQWSRDFVKLTKRQIKEIDIEKIKKDNVDDFIGNVLSTWQALPKRVGAFTLLAGAKRTLLICDEHHHAGKDKSWGLSIQPLIKATNENGGFTVILSGTPIRSDNGKIAGIDYDTFGQMDHPEDGTYNLTYGEAVELRYCRPAVFYRHNADIEIVQDIGEGEQKQAYTYSLNGNSESATIDPKIRKLLTKSQLRTLKQNLNFLDVCTRLSEPHDVKRPSMHTYQASILRAAVRKLNEVRAGEKPNAAGLVIASSQKAARYIQKALKIIDNEGREAKDQQEPELIISDTKKATEAINSFRENFEARWVVSVAMISEGVDIPRIRVEVFLPNAKTELFFRQAFARAVRHDPNPCADDPSKKEELDLSYAYIFMPACKLFDDFAKRVEGEMKAIGAKDQDHKICPDCGHHCHKKAKVCPQCGYEFPYGPPPPPPPVECEHCGFQNPPRTKICLGCGEHVHKLEKISVNMKSIFEDGAYSRDQYFSEEEKREAEALAKEFNAVLNEIGDKVMRILKSTIPDIYLKRWQDVWNEVHSRKTKGGTKYQAI